MSVSPHSLFVGRVLSRLLARHDVVQAFLFHGDGEPFYAARSPIKPDEFVLLHAAFDLIDELEAERPRPFVGHDADHRFSVTAMSAESNMYLVCLGLGPSPVAAEQRLERFRADLLPDLPRIEEPNLRLA